MFKSRRFFLICYQESCGDLPTVIRNLGCDGYAYILHDQDTDASGQLKKPHYHVILDFENERQSNVIAEAFSTAENNVERCKSLSGAVKYLVHAENPEKYQYDKAFIVSNNINISKYLQFATESLQVAEILRIIEFHSAFPGRHFSDVISDCCANGLYSVLRRGNSLFLTVWKEKRSNYIAE